MVYKIPEMHILDSTSTSLLYILYFIEIIQSLKVAQGFKMV
ncbi:hypothetical protein J2752_002931 [Halarchaeum rubridurum]|uniref:Uncharacterized protein n=1 Tax=Halarchaeum rubridurum TaxID=489911 RepID=A0A8T4GQR3_9EURY|nr:hypothetical protein [Halarchaeum rubridurum]